MTTPSDIIAVTSLDELAREAALARTCGHPLAGDILDALVEMRAPETPDLDCAQSLRRACVPGDEYQRLAEQVAQAEQRTDRFRESYRMACRMLRDAEAERNRARDLAARLEAQLAESVAKAHTCACGHSYASHAGPYCECCPTDDHCIDLLASLAECMCGHSIEDHGADAGECGYNDHCAEFRDTTLVCLCGHSIHDHTGDVCDYAEECLCLQLSDSALLDEAIREQIARDLAGGA